MKFFFPFYDQGLSSHAYIRPFLQRGRYHQFLAYFIGPDKFIKSDLDLVFVKTDRPVQGFGFFHTGWSFIPWSARGRSDFCTGRQEEQKEKGNEDMKESLQL